MKITARQVPPENQISPVYWDIDDCYPGIIITGNRHFNSHTTPIFDKISERWDDEKTVLRALHLLTGKRHEKRTIYGCCQGDWQYVFYPVDDYTQNDINRLEIEYFNLGTEWIITSDEDPDGFSAYCYKTGVDEIRAEIAEITGVSVEEVKLLVFDGYTQTPKYKEV